MATRAKSSVASARSTPLRGEAVHHGPALSSARAAAASSVESEPATPAPTALARAPARTAIPTPARTCLSLPRRTRARHGRSHALASLAGRPLTRRNRRGLTAAGSAGWGRRRARDRQQGQAAAFGSPLRGADSVVNQWWRLRSSEYQGGPRGRFQHAHPQYAPTIPTGAATAGQLAASAGVAGSDAAASASAPACQAAANATLRRGGSSACAASRRGDGTSCDGVAHRESAVRPDLDISVSGMRRLRHIGHPRPRATPVPCAPPSGGVSGTSAARIRRAWQQGHAPARRHCRVVWPQPTISAASHNVARHSSIM